MRRIFAGVAVLPGLLLGAWAGHRLWPTRIDYYPKSFVPAWQQTGIRPVVVLPERFLVAEIGAYDDEFYAYLMYQYFAGAKPFRHSELMLTYKRSNATLTYAVQVLLPNDLMSALPLLVNAQHGGLIRQFEWRYVPEDTLRTYRYQTLVFNTAYNLTTPTKIEDMSRAELVSLVRRFVRFKSSVDPRIRRKIQPIPRQLSEDEAHRLALDILAVVDFYSLPLEFFLGIGAMENNYMNVKGDLDHAVWKKRADAGDIVLKRRKNRVLVLNASSGVWQITRETLRYVHKLYLKDQRDYSLLPEHLLPKREVNLDEPDPQLLTTYAGLLFRDLLDHFNGDVATAVGAYNGGRANPNLRYEQGVRMVAQYARRMMQHAAALNGRRAAGMYFMRPGN